MVQTLSESELEARLYRAAVPRAAHHLETDYARVHQELKRSGVTRQLLWEDYAQANELTYKFTSFCVKYRAWAEGLKRSMRQTHVAGDKLFVDYAGDTMPIVDSATGDIRQAQIFVAALGASSFTYACATDADGARLGRLDHQRAGVHRRRGALGGAQSAARPHRAIRAAFSGALEAKSVNSERDIDRATSPAPLGC
ncbi:transposase [Variovorax sp. SRS16]|uniref:transposase n=1 Tax=Variovorax sp. SRS16 TaxID=282217 RepID=UPI0018D94959|nr:transposase [Variovorax sp. SRS16]